MEYIDPLKVAYYAERHVEQELIARGFEVSKVPVRGVDFIARRQDGSWAYIQVKGGGPRFKNWLIGGNPEHGLADFWVFVRLNEHYQVTESFVVPTSVVLQTRASVPRFAYWPAHGGGPSAYRGAWNAIESGLRPPTAPSF